MRSRGGDGVSQRCPSANVSREGMPDLAEHNGGEDPALPGPCGGTG